MSTVRMFILHVQKHDRLPGYSKLFIVLLVENSWKLGQYME
jgi:hypothetical protein